MKHLLVPLLELFRGKQAGYRLAALFFIVSLLWVIFGIIDLLFILIMTLIGYFLGILYFTEPDKLRDLLDKLFPSGRFR